MNFKGSTFYVSSSVCRASFKIIKDSPPVATKSLQQKPPVATYGKKYPTLKSHLLQVPATSAGGGTSKANRQEQGKRSSVESVPYPKSILKKPQTAPPPSKSCEPKTFEISSVSTLKVYSFSVTRIPDVKISANSASPAPQVSPRPAHQPIRQQAPSADPGQAAFMLQQAALLTLMAEQQAVAAASKRGDGSVVPPSKETSGGGLLSPEIAAAVARMSAAAASATPLGPIDPAILTKLSAQFPAGAFNTYCLIVY